MVWLPGGVTFVPDLRTVTLTIPALVDIRGE